ncbi:hypothetical protein OE88DRAFT_1659240 [Heliocybe sulcata]|uniref:Uncharacterized protein n=1 Tax=Heliocybe sulcata TaxID=5364 RepID=A0A5C3N0P9_9AGAM|nr:hypothetical protein OE88DRAFT_1659240 [Heliocybe sulcata]
MCDSVSPAAISFSTGLTERCTKRGKGLGRLWFQSPVSRLGWDDTRWTTLTE